jgi:acetamidase/formamidase
MTSRSNMSSPTLHRLRTIRENLHGTYHRDNAPVLSIQSGDIVNFETLEVGWRTERVVPDKELACIPNRDPSADNGPALTGPVYVVGAEPGMVLQIEFLEFKPGAWGWTSGGGSATRIAELEGVLNEKASLFWNLDRNQNIATNQWGHQVRMRPFLGCVGLASSDQDRLPGWYPHPRTGGNMDANVLTQGTSLFLPVEVEGALLSVGDAHAAQGDGEISGTAIECPMDEARLKITLHQATGIRRPRALKDGHWITFGIAPTLDDAAVIAINEMLTLITEKTNLSRSEALAISSTLVDLRVTQLVNPLKGIHAILKTRVEALNGK